MDSFLWKLVGIIVALVVIFTIAFKYEADDCESEGGKYVQTNKDAPTYITSDGKVVTPIAEFDCIK